MDFGNLSHPNLPIQTTSHSTSPIVHAILEAEESTSGKIRVHLSKRWLEIDPLRRATQLFEHYQLADTPERNAVLIYVNLRKRKFAILGDKGLNQAVGPNYWRALAKEMTDNLRSTQNENAIALIIVSIGKTLKKHFPLTNK